MGGLFDSNNPASLPPILGFPTFGSNALYSKSRDYRPNLRACIRKCIRNEVMGARLRH